MVLLLQLPANAEAVLTTTEQGITLVRMNPRLEAQCRFAMDTAALQEQVGGVGAGGRGGLGAALRKGLCTVIGL